MSIPPEEGEPRGPSSAEEALRRLEQRLDRATEAAERLMAEAASEAARVGSAAGGGSPEGGGSPGGGGSAGSAGDPGGVGNPGDRVGVGAGNPGDPGGTGNPGDPGGAGNPGDPPKPPPAGWQIPEGSRAGTADLDPLVALVQTLRDLIPPELQRRLVAALRELLLALRALIDWYLERLERRREQSVEVEDIPIL